MGINEMTDRHAVTAVEKKKTHLAQILIRVFG